MHQSTPTVKVERTAEKRNTENWTYVERGKLTGTNPTKRLKKPTIPITRTKNNTQTTILDKYNQLIQKGSKLIKKW